MQVIARVLSGDSEAFGKLMQRYYGACSRYAVMYLGDRDLADDAIQETFLRAYRSLSSCKEPDKFWCWLFPIVRNCCKTAFATRWKREKRFVPMEASIISFVSNESEAKCTSSLSHLGQSNILRNMDDWYDRDTATVLNSVARAVKCLPSKYRDAIILKYVDDLTYEEMSRVTGANVSALKMRVSRATDMLRQRIDSN